MSRIGKKPILIPKDVDVKMSGNAVLIKGPKGEISRIIPSNIGVAVKEGKIFVEPLRSDRETNVFWGLIRADLNNYVKGVIDGYEKRMEIEGVGYKAVVEGNEIVLNVGFTHQIRVRAPEGVKFAVQKNVIIVSGIDKAKVTQTAARVKKVKPPEPYKGKGIRYQGETVRRKVGKRATSAGT